MARGVGETRGEEAERVVAPVICRAVFDQVAVIQVVMDRHELEGGNTKALEMVDDRLGGDSRIAAAVLLRHPRVVHCEAADVSFVNKSLVPGDSGRAVVAP